MKTERKFLITNRRETIVDLVFSVGMMTIIADCIAHGAWLSLGIIGIVLISFMFGSAY